jgi:hypothetical protein
MNDNKIRRNKSVFNKAKVEDSKKGIKEAGRSCSRNTTNKVR